IRPFEPSMGWIDGNPMHEESLSAAKMAKVDFIVNVVNNIPEKLINFRVYLDGTDLLGVADVDLPNLEGLTDAVRGAGIAGEIDSPALGHYSPMTLGLNWRTVTGTVTHLAAPIEHHLVLRGS
ncbi:phage major tail tube protein, partial [Acetomicrobium sp. S15 = DSM 107314]|uniref:phage major tail tube protein n=1 Tax=Acetomicrobium sp. S15 = DSM 107314 TaxID=2529858 RepID=UPI001E291166